MSAEFITRCVCGILSTSGLCEHLGAAKEQPMSDTLQEREDQVTTGEINKRWCDECKGVIHAPWCSEYKEPDQRCPFTRTWVPDPCVLPKGHTGKHMNAVEQAVANKYPAQDAGHKSVDGDPEGYGDPASEHQPAARGGGDLVTTARDFVIHLGEARKTALCKAITHTADLFKSQKIINQLADEVIVQRNAVDNVIQQQMNRHQSLVAEREQMVEALKGVAIILNTELEKYDKEPWAQRVRAALSDQNGMREG